MSPQTTDSDNSVISVNATLDEKRICIWASSTEAAEKIHDALMPKHKGIKRFYSRTDSFFLFKFFHNQALTTHLPKIVKTLVEAGYLTENTSIEVNGQGTTINQILEEEPAATETEPQTSTLTLVF